MLSWILIALAIAIIFGVIKIDSLKKMAEDIQPKFQQYLSKIQSCGKAKIEEMKTLANKKSDNNEVSTPSEQTEEKNEE